MAHFADDLGKITTIGKEGKNDSAKLAELAEKVKALTEEQLLSTGIFILPQYRKAEAQVMAMATDPAISAQRARLPNQTLQR